MVTKNVPPYAIVAGNPAQVKKYRFQNATIQRLLALEWWEWNATMILENRGQLTASVPGSTSDNDDDDEDKASQTWLDGAIH